MCSGDGSGDLAAGGTRGQEGLDPQVIETLGSRRGEEEPEVRNRFHGGMAVGVSGALAEDRQRSDADAPGLQDNEASLLQRCGQVREVSQQDLRLFVRTVGETVVQEDDRRPASAGGPGGSRSPYRR